MSKLYQFIGLSTLFLDYKSSTKSVHYSVYNHYKIHKDYVKFDIKSDGYVARQLDATPDILLLSVYESHKHVNVYNSNHYRVRDAVNENSLSSFEDSITYNGVRYVLDSVLLTNWNKKKEKVRHVICGITCKKQRYVYNGWTRYSLDANISQNDRSRYVELPCELMRFDWNVKKTSNFCLNTKLCKLPKPDKSQVKNEVCFSFNKGD